MKLFASITLLAAMLDMAAAFAPSPAFGVSRSVAPPTATFLVPDADFLHLLSQNCADAVSLTLVECDNQECAEATGWNNGDGWQFKGGLEGEKETTKKILMMVMGDTE